MEWTNHYLFHAKGLHNQHLICRHIVRPTLESCCVVDHSVTATGEGNANISDDDIRAFLDDICAMLCQLCNAVPIGALIMPHFWILSAILASILETFGSCYDLLDIKMWEILIVHVHSS
jgi:hypothetical protein